MNPTFSSQETAMNAQIQQTVRADIRSMKAYSVQPVAPDTIKLDAMESPYGLPADIWQTITARIAQLPVHRYPAAALVDLEQAVKTAFAVPTEVGVLFGNGSDELIHLLIQATCTPDDVVMAPTPSFVMYEVSAQFNHARFVGVPLTEHFELNIDAMLQAIEQHQPKVIFLAVPNNPTGNVWSEQHIQAIIKAAPGLVIIDEAYQPFLATTYLPYVQECSNVLVLRTVSKMGLAGVRFGYLLGAKQWLEHINKVRPPYNINVLTACLVQTVLEHKQVLDQHTAAIVQQREVLYQALQKVHGIQVYPSQANFFLFRFEQANRAATVYSALKAQNILVRPFHQHPQLGNCLRVSIGTPEENALFIHSLSVIVSA